VQLVEGIGRPIKTYSKGMRQRVKLAQTIAHEPELLVLDEPLTGLDPLGRRDVLRLFRELADGGTAILVSSHVLHEVESLATDVLLIHRGRLLAQGQVREIRKLLDQYPARILIQSQRARDLARSLLEFEEVKACRVRDDENMLELETIDLDRFWELMTSLCAEGAYGVSTMKSVDEGLEAVFDYLVE
jgi:ABC-2 type transport system ATP-binding protein